MLVRGKSSEVAMDVLFISRATKTKLEIVNKADQDAIVESSVVLSARCCRDSSTAIAIAR
jgi:hypothetical protein